MFSAECLAQTINMSWPLVERENGSFYNKKYQQRFASKFWTKNHFFERENIKWSVSMLSQGKITALNLLREFNNDELVRMRIEECNSEVETIKISICRKNILRELNALLRANNFIDDTCTIIIDSYIEKDKKRISILNSKELDLPEHHGNMMYLKELRILNNLTNSPSLFVKKDFVRNVSPWGKISARQDLFLNYQIIEVKILSSLLSKTTDRINASVMVTQIDFEGDGIFDETIPIDQSKKTTRSFEILSEEIIKETASDGQLANQKVKHLHLLLAANETTVPDGVIEVLMKFPNIEWKKENKHKIYLMALWSIGKTALFATPGGIYFILPIIVVESIFEMKAEQK